MSLRHLVVLPFVFAQAACTLAEGGGTDETARGNQVPPAPPAEVVEQEVDFDPTASLARSDDLLTGLPVADFTTPEETSGPQVEETGT